MGIVNSPKPWVRGSAAFTPQCEAAFMPNQKKVQRRLRRLIRVEIFNTTFSVANLLAGFYPLTVRDGQKMVGTGKVAVVR